MATLKARLADMERRLNPAPAPLAAVVQIVVGQASDEQVAQAAQARAEGRRVVVAHVVSARVRPDLA